MKRWQKIVGIVIASLVAVLIVASFILDSILTSKAHAEAQMLSQQWGRPVQIGSVSTKLFTGLGARVSGIEIGAAQGESVPLVAVQEVAVSVGLLPHFHVRSAEVDGLAVDIERFADGSTNLEHFQDKLPKSPEPATPKEPTDLSWLRVDHAAVREGKISLHDQGKTLAIDHLEITVNDLREGKPLEVVLKAAVLAQKQNLELRVQSAPLPKTLQPTPTGLSLHVDPPIDLAPLGPFAGKSVGLEAGTLDADFDARLGAVMPGGEGATAVKGVIKLAGLKFKASEGGKKLDVTLDADVKGDASKGEVQMDKLRLDIGPASITGRGSAQGLDTPSPNIKGLQLASHDLDLEKLAAYYPPLRKQMGGVVSGPIGLSVQGSGHSLELRVDLTPVKIAMPEQMSKAAGAPMTIVAHLSASSKFDAKVDLSGVDLRPGGSLDKAPGQRLDVALEGTRSAQRVELANLKAHVLDDEAQGSGWYEAKGAQRKFEMQLASSHLDLDKLLLPGTTKKKESKPLDPQLFAGLSGHASVKLDKVVYKKQTISEIVADVSMQEDEVKVATATLKAFGGTATAGGTELKLAHPDAPFHVVAKLDKVGLESLLALVTEHKLLGGTFNGNIDLSGAGDLARTLNGNVDGHILDGVFYGKDVVASVSGPLAKSLPFGLAGKEGQGGSTSLGKDLPLSVSIEKGMAKLKQPIKISTAQADLTFSGGARVDGQLAMPGTVALAPDTISTITGGKVKPSQPIPVNLELTGPAWSPSVTNLDLKPAVTQIVKEGGAALVGRALGVDAAQPQKAMGKKADSIRKDAEQQARDRLKGIFGK